MDTQVLIVGGGPAGLTAALFAAQRGLRVMVLEQNDRPCKKLMITGKGRCNVTNDCPRDEVMSHIRRGDRFLFSAFAQFSPQDAMALFESIGVPLKTERGRRVFPQSDKATDVAQALVAAVKRLGVTIRKGRARRLLTAGGDMPRVTGVALSTGETITAPAVVIATGGLSYPLTGSRGDGYTLAKQVGHRVVEPHASLVPIETNEDYVTDMQGLSLKNVALSLVHAQSGKVVYKEQGEMLFTHFGVSGPLVLTASSYLTEHNPCDFRLRIDWKPALTVEQLDARLLREIGANPNKNLSNTIGAMLPARAVEPFLRAAGVPPDVKGHALTKEMRMALLLAFKGFTMTVRALRPIDEAVVTAGGIDCRDLDPRTMASKLVKGLYFAGEVIDADAVTGGYNLQIAWSTGFAAGSHVAID